MASVIFFRAVNVGGHQKFQPSLLAKELADLDIVNIGAAGTFVVRATAAAAKLRAAIHDRLHFQPELMICPARAVLALVNSDPYHEVSAAANMTRYVSILSKAPRTAPKLPLDFPTPGPWEVRILSITGSFVLSLQRPGKKGLYPNALVEKQLGLPATTRNWNTLLKISEALKD